MVQWSSNLMKELEDAQKLEGSADGKEDPNGIDRQIGINYDKLTEDEQIS